MWVMSGLKLKMIDSNCYDSNRDAQDARSLRRFKRKRANVNGFGVESSTNNLREFLSAREKENEIIDVDSDYVEFLRKMAQVTELTFKTSQGNKLKPSLKSGNYKDGSKDDTDAEYLTFLKKLSKDGKSYVLELHGNNGELVALKYEEDVLDEDGDPLTQMKTNRSLLEMEFETETCFRIQLEKNMLETLEMVDNLEIQDMQNEKLDSHSKSQMDKKSRNSIKLDSLQDKEMGKEVEMHLMLQTEKFISSRINWNSGQKFSSGDSYISYTRCRSNGKSHSDYDGGLLFLNNEPIPHTRRNLSGTANDKKAEKSYNLRNVMNRDRMGSSKSACSLQKKEIGSGIIENHMKIQPVNLDFCKMNEHSANKFGSGNYHMLDTTRGNDKEISIQYDNCALPLKNSAPVLRNQIGENSKIATHLIFDLGTKECKNLENVDILQKRRTRGANERHLKSEHVAPISFGIDEYLDEKSSVEDFHTGDAKSINGLKNLRLDDSYVLFLNNMKPEGHHLVLEIDQDVVRYEVGNFFDPEVFIVGDIDAVNKKKCNSPMNSIPVDDSVDGENCDILASPTGSACSYFREKVMIMLKKPYDYQEYEELLRMANARKPMKCHLELRGRDASYSSKKLGKSYLDRHSGLEKKILEVETDQHKVLNLLRGFFFWLQYKCHEGSFPPWLDPLCLSVTPGSE